jgi:hypothetical protein
VFLHTAAVRRDVLGRLSLGNIGLHVSRLLAARFGAERERGIRECARGAAEMLGVRSFSGWSTGERLAWERWSPLILALDEVERWPAQDRRALVRVIRPGPPRIGLRRLFDRHRRLRRAPSGGECAGTAGGGRAAQAARGYDRAAFTIIPRPPDRPGPRPVSRKRSSTGSLATSATQAACRAEVTNRGKWRGACVVAAAGASSTWEAGTAARPGAPDPR